MKKKIKILNQITVRKLTSSSIRRTKEIKNLQERFFPTLIKKLKLKKL